jgi:hypothetical protein
MDINETLLKILIEQTAKSTFEFVPKKFGELFGTKSPKEIIKRFQKNYFYQENFIKSLLFSQNWSAEFGRTDFIDYDIWKEYYPIEKKHVSLKYQGEIKNVVFPFKEEINFISIPKAKMLVSGIKTYTMPRDLEKLTEPNLKKFLSIKPKTFDGSNLRISSLRNLSDNNYECDLEYASYYPQVRTNLTTDYRLESGRIPTLRLLDMEENRGLKPLEQSIMVNTIGTSAIVFFHKEGRAYFFMKLRRQLGIYENMFGTTSGEVENPQEDTEPKDLVSFVSEEMKREFSYETGLNSSKVIKSIRPLAFTRDLIRGGKPQFFFLIEIREVSKKEFSVNFKKSIEGLDEFHDDLIYKLRFRNALSPEFALNLIYAIQALLVERQLDIEPINLDYKLG